MATNNQNPWKSGIAQEVARDLGPPDSTVFFEHTRKPLAKGPGAKGTPTKARGMPKAGRKSNSGKQRKGPFGGKW